MTSSPRYLFSRLGLERLRLRIADARRAYKLVCDSNPEARESGDSSVWHDNFAFEENQRQMHQLARRVRDLEQIFTAASVISPGEIPPDRAIVGSRVTYQLDGDLAPRSCLLAGWDDGDPGLGRVSYNAPLGSALLGAQPGEEREVVMGGKLRVVEVLQVHPDAEELS